MCALLLLVDEVQGGVGEDLSLVQGEELGETFEVVAPDAGQLTAATLDAGADDQADLVDQVSAHELGIDRRAAAEHECLHAIVAGDLGQELIQIEVILAAEHVAAADAVQIGDELRAHASGEDFDDRRVPPCILVVGVLPEDLAVAIEGEADVLPFDDVILISDVGGVQAR